MARALPAVLMGLAALCLLMVQDSCDARRTIVHRHDTMEVTPSEPMDTGGWRPVVNSRSSYEPQPSAPSNPSAPSDSAGQPSDLMPPPPQGPVKVVKKNKPSTRKPILKGSYPELSTSETRVPTSFTLAPPEGPARPVVRFPDDKRRSVIRRRRPEHVHYHLRPNGFSGSESSQTLRFRPSPQIPTSYENSYPSWLLASTDPTQQQQQQQQQHIFYNQENPGLLNVNHQFNGESQLPLALAQQQPEYPQQSDYLPQPQFQQQPEQQQPEFHQQLIPQQGGFIQGTQQVFGNPDLFQLATEAPSVNQRHHQDNAFLLPATEPSVHENEVPVGPQTYVTHSNRIRPLQTFKPSHEEVTESSVSFKTPEPTEPTVFSLRNPSRDNEENIRYRRPHISIHEDSEPSRRPSIHEVVDISRRPVILEQQHRNRRPVNHEVNVEIIRPKPSEIPQEIGEEGKFRPMVQPTQRPQGDENVNVRPRRPRPPTHEGIAENGGQDVPVFTRPRRPRPPPNTQEGFDDIEQSGPAFVRPRKPRPPTQEGLEENTEQDTPATVRQRRPRPPPPPAQDDVDKNSEQNNPRQRRPRPPPPVQEELEDDVEQPKFNLRPRPRRPQQAKEQTEGEEEQTTPELNVRQRRPRPPVADEEARPQKPSFTEEGPEVQDKPVEAQEDIEEPINVRPRRPRPPVDDDRIHNRRPVNEVRKRRPRPPVFEDQEEVPRLSPVRPERPWKPAPTRSRTEEDEGVEETPDIDETIHRHRLEENIPEVLETVEPSTEQPTQPPPQEETTSEVPSTTPRQVRPISLRNRRPVQAEEAQPTAAEEETENYPVHFFSTQEPKLVSTTTEEALLTTTNPPTTTLNIVKSRLRLRQNSTRPRFSVGSYKERFNRFSQANKKNEVSTDASPTAPSGPSGPSAEEVARPVYKPRGVSRFRTTTEEPAVESTTTKPSVKRFTRPSNKYYSRYRASTEEPGTTTVQQDATRRTSTDLYSTKERKPFPALKSHSANVEDGSEPEEHSKDEEHNDASLQFTVVEVTTLSPSDDVMTTVMQEEFVTDLASTTMMPEVGATTPAEDFSPARRVTDLTSSATAFKPLSFFSAVPADGKSASQLRFTMATEDPILPIEAFFPTFTSKPHLQHGEEEEK